MILVPVMTLGKFDTFAHPSTRLLPDQTAESEEMTCNDSCAAASVRSISWEVWAAETKAASNCDGAKNIPRSDRKSTRLNSSHDQISYAVFCLKKKKNSAFERKPVSL